jgi:hypothetical protein
LIACFVLQVARVPRRGRIRRPVQSVDDEESKLTFQHDGAPFNGEEIAHLIFTGSSKNDPAAMDTVGRFGSGFLVTHVLAKNIIVTGLLQPSDSRLLEHFRFALQRDGNNAHELSQSMDESWNAFNSSRTSNGEQGQFTTAFEYPLSASAQALARSGLATLDALAP